MLRTIADPRRSLHCSKDFVCPFEPILHHREWAWPPIRLSGFNSRDAALPVARRPALRGRMPHCSDPQPPPIPAEPCERCMTKNQANPRIAATQIQLGGTP